MTIVGSVRPDQDLPLRQGWITGFWGGFCVAEEKPVRQKHDLPSDRPLRSYCNTKQGRTEDTRIVTALCGETRWLGEITSGILILGMMIKTSDGNNAWNISFIDRIDYEHLMVVVRLTKAVKRM